MTATINGKTYQLREYEPYGYTDILTLYILSESADEIVNTVGKSAVISIPEECTWNEAVLDHVVRFWDTGLSVCEVVFKPFPYEKTVREHGDDIEVMAQAITELAELIV